MLRKITAFLISKIRGKGDYSLEESISDYHLWIYVKLRLLQVLRGLFFAGIRKRKLLFRGSGTKIVGFRNLQLGKSVILEDRVSINCICKKGIAIGNGVTIAQGSVLTALGVIARMGEGIAIGDNCSVGAYSFIAGQGGITIGNNVIMGPQVKIFSENHNYDVGSILIKDQGETRSAVVIKDNCWIGANVTILAGVTIPSGTVVAAGSVVTKSVLVENMIIGGIPAKQIKTRLKPQE